MTVEYILISASLLLLLSVLGSKISDRFGIPALLLFLALGMLAGSEGMGGIYFDDARLAQLIGVIALVLILFSGGLDTDWRSITPVLKEGAILATIGVLVTALIVGLAAVSVLGFSLFEGLLLGAIVSSTDAAAVFSVLRAKSVRLKGQLTPLLELESGSNDPMAVFLTVSFIQLITQPHSSPAGLILRFFAQMGLGAVLGYLIGRGILLLVNRLRLGYDGLYPALTLSLILLAYGVVSFLGGSGFLAVYIAAIVVGNQDFIHKRSILRFHDGVAWLMQIVMFLTLGLLVFPSRLLPIIGPGLLIAACLIVVARPAGAFISLLFSRLHLREKAFVSWVGLRGAVPIVLATYPLLAGVEGAGVIFDVVFFVVLTSALLQGATISQVARALRVAAPGPPQRSDPDEFVLSDGLKGEFKKLTIAPESDLAGKALVELGFSNLLIVLVERGGQFIVPGGGTILEAGDTLFVLAETDAFHQLASKANPRA